MGADEASKEQIGVEDRIQVDSDKTDSSPSDVNELDCEKHGANRESNPLPDLQRKLKSRHLQMIAIGALIPIGSSDAVY